MRILAIEGALARCSVVLMSDDAVIATEGEDVARGHAALLPAMADRVLRRGGIAPASLDVVAVGVGPGSFTGLRAAIALASGIALGAGCQVIGVTTGEALVVALPAGVPRDGPVWSVVDNRRGAVFLEVFSAGAVVADGVARALDLAGLPWHDAPALLVGDAADVVALEGQRRGMTIALGGAGRADAVGVARIAALRHAGRILPRAAVPLYVQPPAVRPPP